MTRLASHPLWVAFPFSRDQITGEGFHEESGLAQEFPLGQRIL